MTWLYIWLGVVVVSLIVEFITMKFISVWISIGALVAMILAACGVWYVIQIIVMVVVSIACLIGLRKITLKILNKNSNKVEEIETLKDVLKDSEKTNKTKND